MDKRVIKTKASIRDVFLSLRDKNKLEKIHVSELCELAQINKTTFYKYYDDIFALNNEICDSVISAVWEGFESRECLLSDTARFIGELPHAIDAQGEVVRILFHDRSEDFFTRLEGLLISRYISADIPRDTQLRMLFGIRGLVRMFYEIKKDSSCTPDELARCVAPLFAAAEESALI